MSLTSAAYYFVRCDNCARPADYDDQAEVWRTPDLAVTQLPAFWTTNGSRHHCPACPPLDEEVPC